MSEQQTRALVLPVSAPPVRFRLARSLKAAAVGEVMALDERGDVVDPRRSRLASARLWLGAATMGALGWGSVAALGGAAFLGPAFLAACVGLVAWESRRLRELKRAIALAASGRRDEAAAAFAVLETRRPGPALKATIDYWIGSLAWQRGQLAEAEKRFDAALGMCYRTSRLEVLGWIVEFSRVQLLAAKGETERAVRIRTELDRAPDGDYFRLARMLTDLTIAFHRGSDDGLPDDLYDWAHEALEMNRFGNGLVLLAWAFTKRGDDEMARHLLRVAPDRLEACFLSETDPTLSRWMEERRAAWDLDAEEELWR